MDRFGIREKLPSRSIFPSFPSDERRRRIALYLKMLSIVLLFTVGATLTLSGVVLVPMMAFDGSITGVVGAASMISSGTVMSVGSYIWITAPA